MNAAESAPTRLSCPNCRKNFKIKNYRAGRPVQCPDCRGPLVDPVASPGEEVALAGQGGWELPVRLGRYHIDGQVARGGMGVVYKATQEGLDRPVAIKMMLPGPAADPEMTGRFSREARSAARLKHPNIVAIHEIGEYRGIPFFSMDFVTGPSLDATMPMTPKKIAAVIRDVARALHYAHGEGIVHRDIKPQNILLEGGETPRLTDFGLAKDFTSQSILSMEGEVMGTPAYMSPEQAQGRTREIGPLTDVYSLGAVLYRMMTGRAPFDAATPYAIVKKVVEDDPLPPDRIRRDVPVELAAVAMKALSKEPRERYANAEEFAADLDRFIAGDPVKARPLAEWKRLARSAKKHKTSVKIAAAGILVGVVAVVLAVFVLKKNALDLVEVNLKSEELAVRQNALTALLSDFEKIADGETARATELAKAAIAHDRDEKTRALALAVLESKPALAVHALAWLDEEKPPALRARLIGLLAKGKVREAVDPVAALLKSKDVEVKRTAVRFFIEVPDASVFHSLGLLITDKDVGKDAREAINRQYALKVVAIFNPAGHNVGGAMGDLADSVARHNQQIEDIMNEKPVDRPTGPKDAAEAAIAELAGPDARNRLKAAIELGRAPSPKADSALLKAVEDPDDGVARAATLALVETGVPAKEKLLPLLQSGRAVVRRNAAVLLAALKDASTKAALEDAFKQEPDEDAKGALLDALQALRK